MQMARVEVEAKLLATTEGVEGPLRRDRVEGDLGGMHLQREPYAALRKHVEDRVPAVRKLLEAGVEHRVGHRRKRIEQMPDRRAGEAVHHRHAQLLGRPGGSLDFLGGPLVDAGRIAVAPHMRRQDRLMSLVDAVADRLADEVAGDGVDREVIPFERVAFGRAVAALLEGAGDIEVITPAGQFQALVAKLAGLAGEIFQRHIGPLAGEQRDGTRHCRVPERKEGCCERTEV